MSADRLNEDRLDEMLGRALRRHSEPVPDDFTDRMLRQIRQAEEQRILARVVLQERLALAGCIVLGVIAIVAAVVLPTMAAGLTRLVEVFVNKITETVKAVGSDWQFYIVLMGMFGFVVYHLVNLLVADS